MTTLSLDVLELLRVDIRPLRGVRLDKYIVEARDLLGLSMEGNFFTEEWVPVRPNMSKWCGTNQEGEREACLAGMLVIKTEGKYDYPHMKGTLPEGFKLPDTFVSLVDDSRDLGAEDITLLEFLDGLRYLYSPTRNGHAIRRIANEMGYQVAEGYTGYTYDLAAILDYFIVNNLELTKKELIYRLCDSSWEGSGY